MQILRWILTIPAAILGWYLGIFAAVFVYYIDIWTCPDEYMVSGSCMAPWSSFLSVTTEAFGAATAAAAIVLLPTLVAPAYRWIVACMAFVCGLLLALYFVFIFREDVWIP